MKKVCIMGASGKLDAVADPASLRCLAILEGDLAYGTTPPSPAGCASAFETPGGNLVVQIIISGRSLGHNHRRNT